MEQQVCARKQQGAAAGGRTRGELRPEKGGGDSMFQGFVCHVKSQESAVGNQEP